MSNAFNACSTELSASRAANSSTFLCQHVMASSAMAAYSGTMLLPGARAVRYGSTGTEVHQHVLGSVLEE